MVTLRLIGILINKNTNCTSKRTMSSQQCCNFALENKKRSLNIGATDINLNSSCGLKPCLSLGGIFA